MVVGLEAGMRVWRGRLKDPPCDKHRCLNSDDSEEPFRKIGVRPGIFGCHFGTHDANFRLQFGNFAV